MFMMHQQPLFSQTSSMFFVVSLLLTCFIISSDCGCSIGWNIFEWIFSIVGEENEEKYEYDLRKFSKRCDFNESIFLEMREKGSNGHLINEQKTFWSRVRLALWKRLFFLFLRWTLTFNWVLIHWSVSELSKSLPHSNFCINPFSAWDFEYFYLIFISFLRIKFLNK